MKYTVKLTWQPCCPHSVNIQGAKKQQILRKNLEFISIISGIKVSLTMEKNWGSDVEHRIQSQNTQVRFPVLSFVET